MFKPQLSPFKTYKKQVFEDVLKTIPFIYQIGETPLLREKSKEIPVNKITSKETQAKIAYLKKCLLKYRKLTGKGRGITAIQVGIPERFSVLYVPEITSLRTDVKQSSSKNEIASSPLASRNDKSNLLVIINPVITKQANTLLQYPEICMSANPIIAPVVRPAWIEFDFYDELGRKHFWDLKDSDKEGKMYNRVLQHEIDHMDGIINIDKVQSKELIFESDPHFYDKADFKPVKKLGK